MTEVILFAWGGEMAAVAWGPDAEVCVADAKAAPYYPNPDDGQLRRRLEKVWMNNLTQATVQVCTRLLDGQWRYLDNGSHPAPTWAIRALKEKYPRFSEPAPSQLTLVDMKGKWLPYPVAGAVRYLGLLHNSPLVIVTGEEPTAADPDWARERGPQARAKVYAYLHEHLGIAPGTRVCILY